MINVVNLVVAFLISIAAGCFLLSLGLVLLPKSLASRIVRFVKPELFRDLNNRWVNLINFLVQLSFYGKVTNIGNDVIIGEKFARLSTLSEYCDTIEHNLYFIDLSVDLLRTLNFAVPAARGDLDYDIVSQTFNYLQYYLDKLRIDKQDETFLTHMIGSLNEFEKSFHDLQELKGKEPEDDKVHKVMSQKQFSETVSYFELEILSIPVDGDLEPYPSMP